MGPVFFTWRLKLGQAPLREAEREATFTVIRRIDAPGSWTYAGVVMDDHVHVLAEIGASTTIQREAQR